jgi:threonine/homoserine/homoserine lactone efflux protein
VTEAGFSAAWFGAALAFAVSMSASPGPNNAMVAASGANWGFRRTVPHMLGIAIGFPVMLVAVALGAGEALRAMPAAGAALRWAGAAYLLWLAWSIARATPGAAGEARGAPLGFWGAALFQWVNPKAWVIALGAVLAHTAGTPAIVLAKSLALAGLFFLVTIPVVALWTLAGMGAARLLGTPERLRWFNRAMAALLVLSLVPLLAS